MPLWIFAFLGVYVAVAFLLHRFVAVKAVRDIRRELLEEALPWAMTGSRGDEASPRPLRWTDLANLAAIGAGAAGAAVDRDPESREVPVGTAE